MGKSAGVSEEKTIKGVAKEKMTSDDWAFVYGLHQVLIKKEY